MIKHLFPIFLICLSISCLAQGVQKQEKIAALNAYVYYPLGYETGKKFPLMVFFPGKDEAGTVASKLLVHGPSKFIQSGWKPNFMVISIQPTYAWVTEQIIDKVLTEILKKYQVDSSSIHLTGLSAGATGIERFGLTPAYVKRVSSITSLSAPELPSYHKNIDSSMQKQVHWLGFVGTRDFVYEKMKARWDLYNKSVPGIATLIIGSYDHCCWDENVYDPNKVIPALNSNMYDWVLSKGGIKIDPPRIDTLQYIKILHDPKDIMEVIILDKGGKWHKYDSTGVKTGTLRVEFH